MVVMVLAQTAGAKASEKAVIPASADDFMMGS
jgi:hypothetical protein